MVKLTSSPFRGGFYIWRKQYLEPLPIRRIDFGNSADQQMHSAIVAKVGSILDLQARLEPIRHSPSSIRDDLLREIDRVEQQTNQLVYELYELTHEEIKLVGV